MDRKNPYIPLESFTLPPEGDKPLEVCLVRGEAVESRHRVHVMVVDAAGETVHRWGKEDLRFFPRSAIKLMQAAAWVSLGIDRTYKLGQEELSLACGSHEGESYHVQKVQAWLGRLGLEEGSLECGAHMPYHLPSAYDLIRAGKTPTQLHNNCSGKHAGFLTCCIANQWPVQGYINYDHPLQASVRRILGDFFGMDMSKAPWGVDGCGIPTYSISLEGMARAMAKSADPSGLEGNVQEAVRLLSAAIAAQPRYMGGTSSFCSEVVTHTEGRVLAKLGAEGVYGAWLPEAGLGLAMKGEDGNARATEVAMAAVLRELGYPLGFFSPLVRRWTGEVVGQFICS